LAGSSTMLRACPLVAVRLVRGRRGHSHRSRDGLLPRPPRPPGLPD
jgi:hypothetical protein